MKSEYDDNDFDKDDYSSSKQYKQQDKEGTPKNENKFHMKNNYEDEDDHDITNLRSQKMVQKVNKSIDAHK